MHEVIKEVRALRMLLEQDRLLSVAEAAEILGISTDGMYKLKEAEGFPVIRLGRLIKFRKSTLLDFVEANDLSAIM